MLQALLVTFREGLESFLIVGVISAYLRKTGRPALMRGVRAGLALSLVACLVGAYLWQLVPNQPLYEGIAAMAAALLVGAFLVQMLRVGRHMKGDIEARIARVANKVIQPAAPRSEDEGDAGVAARSARPSLSTLAGMALITALLVTREGLEAVLYLGIQIRMSGSGAASAVGGALGLVLASGVAWVWSSYAHRLNLKIVLKVTAVFLGLFLFQLLIYGVHELAESGVIEGSQSLHNATEIFGPQGAIGHILSYALLAAPLLYLLWNRRGGAPRPPAGPSRARPAGV